MSDERRRLRSTFDRAAELYDDARPEYPEQLFDTLVEVAGLHAGDSVLEIGCGTGKATIPLAQHRLRITCIEIGAHLAAVARRNLVEFPQVVVVDGDFDSLQPPTEQLFDLVFAATAWHWLDPVTRYRRAWELLRPGGHLAFWCASHVIPDSGDRFFAEIQDVYDEIGEGLPAGWRRRRPGELPDDRAEIKETRLFDDVVVEHFDWEVSYDAEAYVRLLDTFSGHIDMAPWKRNYLYGEIRRRLAQRPDGAVRRHWGAVLHVARRLGPDMVSLPNRTLSSAPCEVTPRTTSVSVGGCCS